MNKKGFSIVEVAGVLTIITLLISGIAVAQSMVRQAQLRKVIIDVKNYKAAMDTFEDLYKYMAGDFPLATTMLNNAYANGNGDGIIGIGTSYTLEPYYAWNHLSVAGLVSGTYNGIGISDSEFNPGVNIPGVLGNTAVLYWWTSSAFTESGITIHGRWGTYIELFYNSAGQVTPTEAYSIDMKIDDGIPTAGNVFTVKGFGYSGYSPYCVTNEYSQAPPATYVLTDTQLTCRMFFWTKTIN